MRDKTGSAHQKCGIFLLLRTRENWGPDPREGLRGGHWRSVSYRFICKHEKTSSGVNKNTEPPWGHFPGSKAIN